MTLSSGFPLTNVGTVAPNTAPTGTEGAVIDKDSTGKIWVGWTSAKRVWVTHSTTDQTTFVAPYVPPVPNADNLTADDMATLVAYDGRIGVLWSNQTSWCMCFAIHADGAADSAWTSRPMIGPMAPRADNSHRMADDHMNLKAANDGSGRLFAISKTERLDGAGPLLLFNVLNGATWSNVVVGTVAENSTRPIVAIDTQHNKGYAISANPCCSGGIVYIKQTSLTSPGFSSGLGTPFMRRADVPLLNDVTTTKQTVDGTSDLVVLAGDDGPKRYVHNTLDLGPGAPALDSSIDSGPQGTASTASATFTFSSAAPGSTFECKLDTGAFAACSSPKSYAGLTDGSHRFEVPAIDSAGTGESTPAARTWTVENPANVVSVVAEADTYAKSTPNANHGTATVLYTDKAVAGVFGDSDKQSFLRFTISDPRAIVSAKLRLWVTDATATRPSLFSTSNSWAETTLNWTNKPAPAGAALDARPGGVSTGYVEYDVTPAVTARGTYSFVTTTASTDAMAIASREAPTPEQRPALLLRINPAGPDTTAPPAPASSLLPSSDTGSSSSDRITADATPTFSGTAEAGATVRLRANGTQIGEALANSAGDWTVTIGDLADGSYAVTATASDQAGNTSFGSSALALVIDTTPPDTAITSKPANPSATGSVSFEFTATQSGSTFECSIDGQAYASCTSPRSYSATAGSHSFGVRATDLAGNIDTTPATHSWTAGGAPVDTTAPQTTIGSAPANPSSAVTASIGFSSDESGATFACRLDNSSWSTCTSPYAASGLAQGSHTFEVRATDLAGNVDATPATHTWTVDTTAPDIFADGFESASFSAWNPGLTGGLGGDGAAVVVTDVVKTGTYAARLSETASTASFARLRLGLPSPFTDTVTVEANIRVEAEGAAGGNVPLLRLFNASGTRLLSLYRQNATAGAMHVNHGTATPIGRNLALGTWVDVRVRVVARTAGASTVTVTWDGVQAYTTDVSNIASPVATVQVGNETKGQAFRLVVDDVTAAQR